MLEFDYDSHQIRLLVAELGSVEPNLVNEFKAKLKRTASTDAKDIVTKINSLKPLSGMLKQTDGALTWQGAKAITSYAISYKRGTSVTPLLSIKIDNKNLAPGYMVTELAGKRNPRGLTPRGATMIDRINWRFGELRGRGGNRIAWKFFWDKRQRLNADAKNVVEEYSAKVTSKVN